MHTSQRAAAASENCPATQISQAAAPAWEKNWERLYGLESAPKVRQQFSMQSERTTRLPWWHGDRKTFHFMVRDYKPRYFYFEIVEFVRKFALTGLLMGVANRGSASQIVLGLLISFGFGVINAVMQPY
eukprot:SAG31_NODE_30054_length_386_cov_0.641115_1_plen_128_part_11